MGPVPIRIEDHPITIELAGHTFRQDAFEHNTLQFAEAFAAKDISDLTDSERVGIHTILVNGIQNHLYPSKIQSMLFDRFGALNRDWRRVAITEVGNCQVNGYLAGLRPGTQVKRIEAADCCPQCLPFRDRIYTVRDPGDPNKNWETDVWVGKTNIGRSGKRHKMVNGQLVARTPEEMYVIAPLIHVSCRGMFQQLVTPTTNSQVQAGRGRLRAMLQERGIRSVV